MVLVLTNTFKKPFPTSTNPSSIVGGVLWSWRRLIWIREFISLSAPVSFAGRLMIECYVLFVIEERWCGCRPQLLISPIFSLSFEIKYHSDEFFIPWGRCFTVNTFAGLMKQWSRHWLNDWYRAVKAQTEGFVYAEMQFLQPWKLQASECTIRNPARHRLVGN